VHCVVRHILHKTASSTIINDIVKIHVSTALYGALWSSSPLIDRHVQCGDIVPYMSCLLFWIIIQNEIQEDRFRLGVLNRRYCAITWWWFDVMYISQTKMKRTVSFMMLLYL